MFTTFSCIIEHGVLWCRGILTEWLRGLRHLPALYKKTEDKDKCYLVVGRSRMALAFLLP